MHDDAPPSALALLATRRFWPLALSQAASALVDNLVKNAMVVLAVFGAGSQGTAFAALAGALFIAPYAILSATAGQLADRLAKPRLILLTKYFELALLLLAALGFILASTPILLAVMFGLGVQAALFSPLKYGILPELLDGHELLPGNGLIEASTFVAILLGTVAGGALVILPGGPIIVAGLGLAVSLSGLLAARAIPALPPAAPELRLDWNLYAETTRVLSAARHIPIIWRSLLGISWFWALGATILAEFPALVRDELGAGGEVVTLLLTIFALGVGIGSLACGKLLHGALTPRLVPWMGLGMSLFLADFAWTASSTTLPTIAAMLTGLQGWRLIADLLLLAACGGAYSVPLYALVQANAPHDARARMIAANNIANAIAMVAGGIVIAALAALGLPASTVLLMSAVLNLLMAAWAWKNFRPRHQVIDFGKNGAARQD